MIKAFNFVIIHFLRYIIFSSDFRAGENLLFLLILLFLNLYWMEQFGGLVVGF